MRGVEVDREQGGERGEGREREKERGKLCYSITQR